MDSRFTLIQTLKTASDQRTSECSSLFLKLRVVDHSVPLPSAHHQTPGPPPPPPLTTLTHSTTSMAATLPRVPTHHHHRPHCHPITPPVKTIMAALPPPHIPYPRWVTPFTVSPSLYHPHGSLPATAPKHRHGSHPHRPVPPPPLPIATMTVTSLPPPTIATMITLLVTLPSLPVATSLTPELPALPP